MIGDWPTIVWRFVLSCVGIGMLAAGLHGYLLQSRCPVGARRCHRRRLCCWSRRHLTRPAGLAVTAGARRLPVHVRQRVAEAGLGRRCGRRSPDRARTHDHAERSPKICARIAGSGCRICARSGTARACARSATTPRTGRGKPVIGIINTWSDINPCHAHLRARAEDVKRGVLQAGGFPLELPAISLSEPFVKPTTMLYRNFLAMETEELLRSHPIDGAVLLGGCDKTTPGLLMGAISMGLPAIYLPGRADAARQLARPARWARARTCGNTGTRSAPAASARPTGPRSRTASPARSAPA